MIKRVAQLFTIVEKNTNRTQCLKIAKKVFRFLKVKSFYIQDFHFSTTVHVRRSCILVIFLLCIVFPNSIGAQENSIFAFRFVLCSTILFAIFYPPIVFFCFLAVSNCLQC